jgi:hypothetical protein
MTSFAGVRSLRDVTLYVDKTVAELTAPPSKNGRGRPLEPFKNTPGELIVYYGRLAAMSTFQR